MNLLSSICRKRHHQPTVEFHTHIKEEDFIDIKSFSQGEIICLATKCLKIYKVDKNGSKLKHALKCRDSSRFVCVLQISPNLMGVCTETCLFLFQINSFTCLKKTWLHSMPHLTGYLGTGNRQYLAFRSYKNGEIYIWDWKKSKIDRILQAHTEPVIRVKFLNAEILVTSSEDSTLKVWKFPSGECVAIMEAELIYHEKKRLSWETWSNFTFNNLALLPTGELIATLTSEILVWDLSTNRCVSRFSPHHSAIMSLEVLSARNVAIGSTNNKITIWDVLTRKHLRTIVVPFNQKDDDFVPYLSIIRPDTLAIAPINSGIFICFFDPIL